MPRRAPSPVTPRKGLSRDGIAETAMRILDSHGLDAVTMRRVATELGTGPASLYAHVKGIDDLYAILVETAMADVVYPELTGDWREDTKAFIRLIRTMYTDHRDLARASMGVIPTGPHGLRGADYLLGVLRQGDITDQAAAWAVDILALYGTAVALEEGMIDSPQKDPEYHESIHEHFQALPPDQFPNMAALATELTTGDGDDRFEFGLEVLIAGIATFKKTR